MERKGKRASFYPFIARSVDGEIFGKGEGAREDGDVISSCSFLLDFLEKKRRQEGTERGWRGRVGRQGYALILQGALREKPFRKGNGQETRGMSCLLVPSYWTSLRKNKSSW